MKFSVRAQSLSSEASIELRAIEGVFPPGNREYSDDVAKHVRHRNCSGHQAIHTEEQREPGQRQQANGLQRGGKFHECSARDRRAAL